MLGLYKMQNLVSASYCLPVSARGRSWSRGAETAVLVDINEWKRLNAAARPSLKSLLLADFARTDFELPARGAAQRRPAIAL